MFTPLFPSSLEIFYIEITPNAIMNHLAKEKAGNKLQSFSSIVSTAPDGETDPFKIAQRMGLSISKDFFWEFKKIINNDRFYVITSIEELNSFKNATGGLWNFNSKNKKKSFYIRHPKAEKSNLLIEAKSFYKYIEDEQKAELDNYIFSHCTPKILQIYRKDNLKAGAKVAAKLKGVDATVELGMSIDRGNYYSYENPNGAPFTEKRDKYFWISEQFKGRIDKCNKGASTIIQFDYDYTFGLSGKEAKSIGLDIHIHKKFYYVFYIHC